MFNSSDNKSDTDVGPSYTLVASQVGSPPLLNDSLASEVINHEIVLQSAKRCNHSERQHTDGEIALWQMEEDRHECDVLIENIAATVAVLEPLLEEIGSLEPAAQNAFDLGAHGDKLSLLQIRTIERLYGDKGYMLVNALYENPCAVVPVVLARLKQRHQKFCELRSSLDPKWLEISKHEYYSSLDHCSVKLLSEDEALYKEKSVALEDAISASHEGIEYVYGDGLHSDAGCLDLIKQLSTPADFAPVSRWWSSFLTPFLGLGSANNEGAATTATACHGGDGASSRTHFHGTLEAAALMQVHQQIHRRMVQLRRLVKECAPDGEQGLWDTVMEKIQSKAEGKLSKADFESWLNETLDPRAYVVFNIDTLISAMVRRCGALMTSSTWSTAFEAWEAGRAVNEAHVVDMKWNAATTTLSTVSRAAQLAHQQAKAASEAAAAVAAAAAAASAAAAAAAKREALPPLDIPPLRRADKAPHLPHAAVPMHGVPGAPSMMMGGVHTAAALAGLAPTTFPAAPPTTFPALTPAGSLPPLGHAQMGMRVSPPLSMNHGAMPGAAHMAGTMPGTHTALPGSGITGAHGMQPLVSGGAPMMHTGLSAPLGLGTPLVHDPAAAGLQPRVHTSTMNASLANMAAPMPGVNTTAMGSAPTGMMPMGTSAGLMPHTGAGADMVSSGSDMVMGSAARVKVEDEVNTKPTVVQEATVSGDKIPQATPTTVDAATNSAADGFHSVDGDKFGGSGAGEAQGNSVESTVSSDVNTTAPAHVDDKMEKPHNDGAGVPAPQHFPTGDGESV